jgi:5-methylthioribose kinase
VSEVLDIEEPVALLSYLRSTGRILAGEIPSIRRLSGGVSNRTMLVERETGEAWVIKQALPKLRVAVDWFSSPHRIEQEAEGLRWLFRTTTAGAITPLVFADPSNHLFAMKAVAHPHANWKALLMSGQISSNYVEQFGHLLGTIHAAGFREREQVAKVFSDRSFFESLRVEPYYSYSGSQVPQASRFLQTLIDETSRFARTVVHGDYSPKNVLIYRDELVLLDHEAIHFGDPAFDIGFSLTHLLSKAHHFPIWRCDFAAAAALFWETYEHCVSGLELTAGLEERAVRHTLACLLARVAGRSPLEYLCREECERQKDVVTALMGEPPSTIVELIEQFIEMLANYDGNSKTHSPPDS